MARGLVYILTNPCLDGWVKIGMTDSNDIDNRLRQLNAPTNLPLSFRCYATYEVDDPGMVEKRIHNLIDGIDETLRATEQLDNGRLRKREFFRISPETAYNIILNIAMLRGDVDKLKIVAPTKKQAQEEMIADSRSKRSNNSFKLLNILVGDKITFLFDENCVAEVYDDKNSVKYEDDIFSVSSLACKLLREKRNWSNTTQVNGWRYFVKDGVTLNEMRNRMDTASSETSDLE